MSHANNTVDLLRLIVAAQEGPSREGLIDIFMRDRMVTFRQIARKICRNYSYSVANDLGDIESMVAQQALKMIRLAIEDVTELDKVNYSWEGLLFSKSRQMVRQFMDREMMPATEMTGIIRRQRSLQETRDAMRIAMQSEPTNAEVVTEHNEKMYRNRSNPVKQGMVASLDDAKYLRSFANIDDHDNYADERATDGGGDYVLHPTEGPKFLARLIEQCELIDAQEAASPQSSRRSSKPAIENPLASTAQAWFGPLYSGTDPEGPRTATITQISEVLGISATTARAYVFRVRQAAITVCAEQFGITADDL